MSVRNTEIEGDASVGRSVNVGMHARVNGDLRVGHNVTVKGWRDAPNIKGPLKGLYASEERLKEAYPEPEPGWYALVGDALPADVWRAEPNAEHALSYPADCEWMPTGEQGGEPNVCLDQLESDVADLAETSAALTETTSGLEIDVEALKEGLEAERGVRQGEVSQLRGLLSQESQSRISGDNALANQMTGLATQIENLAAMQGGYTIKEIGSDEYEALLESGNADENTLYLVTTDSNEQ